MSDNESTTPFGPGFVAACIVVAAVVTCGVVLLVAGPASPNPAAAADTAAKVEAGAGARDPQAPATPDPRCPTSVAATPNAGGDSSSGNSASGGSSGSGDRAGSASGDSSECDAACSTSGQGDRDGSSGAATPNAGGDSGSDGSASGDSSGCGAACSTSGSGGRAASGSGESASDGSASNAGSDSASDGSASGGSGACARPSRSTCSLPDGDQAVPAAAPAVAGWEVSRRVVVPRSAQFGPAVTDADGFRRCFAHSPTGAVFAAYNVLAALGDPAKLAASARKLMVPGPDTDELLRQTAKESPSTASEATQLAGYRVIAANRDQVTVMLAVPVEAQYMSLTLTMVWHNHDWRLQPPSPGAAVGAPFAQVRNLADFVKWSGL